MDNRKENTVRDIPEWAFERVQELSAEFSRGPDFVINERFPTAQAFARYIAQHEEPPVDPLEKAMAHANGILKGRGDGSYDEIVIALSDVLTAIELSQKEQAK